MAEIFTASSQRTALKMPTTQTLDISSQTIQWQDCGSEGFLIKPLFDDPTGRTWLMKIESGAFSPMHAHAEIEHIYVIEGSFYDQDKTYYAGDYLIRPPQQMHTAGSKDGAIVVVFYVTV